MRTDKNREPAVSGKDREPFNKAGRAHLDKMDFIESGGNLSTQRGGGLVGRMLAWALGETDEDSSAHSKQNPPIKEQSVDEIV